ncbi:hypothetical protein QEN19_003063 [Hanseniaspora menglaensis]
MSTIEAQSYISLLSDSDPAVQLLALRNISEVLDYSWSVVALELVTLEELFEDETFEDQKLAAFVTARVYYYLGNFDQAIKYALASGEYFNIDSEKSDLFVETIITKSLEKYIENRKQIYLLNNKQSKTDIDEMSSAQLREIFVKMVNRCIESQEFRLALGISIDCFETEFVELIFLKAINANGIQQAQKLLSYALQCVHLSVKGQAYKKVILDLLFKIAINMQTPDLLNAEKIAFNNNDIEQFMQLFVFLSQKSENDIEFQGLEYQFAFDIVSYATEEIRQLAFKQIPELYEGDRKDNISSILAGIPTVHFQNHALNSNRSIDLSVLKKAKTNLDGKYSVYHNAVALANSFVHCGTGDDRFVRDNLSWLGKAKHWAKFSATASLGVLHRNDVKNAEKLLQPYLPSNKNPSRFIKAGSLYGLAIIFAGNAGKERISDMFLNLIDVHLPSITSDDASQILLHGTCLGLGITAMGSNNIKYTQPLRDVIEADNSICSEPALYGLGLTTLGFAEPSAIETVLNTATQSEHNNVVQAAGLSLAMMLFEKQELADFYITTKLRESENSFFRYSAPYAIGMAYVGTGNNKAIEWLLEMAVTDSDDNVRRAAATNLGFVLCKDYTQLPKIVNLLVKSHDPHVRCGTALALGISSAGRNYMPAVEMLLTLTKDPVDFVKQHAFIGLAMILIQQTEKSNSKVKEVNELFDTIISTRRTETLTKFGACLGQGIMNACGRNGTIQLENPEFGTINRLSVVGVMMFTQFWSWFPLAHFLNLAFTPCNILAVSAPGFEAPDVSLQCHTKEGIFDYPEIIKEEVSSKPSKTKTAVLSTTSKSGKLKSKLQQMIQKRDELKAEIKEENKIKKENAKAAAIEEQESEKNNSNGKIIFSQQPYKLANFSRVLPNQSKYVSFGKNNDRFVPVKKFKGNPGIIVMKDLKPNAGKVVAVTAIKIEIQHPKKAIKFNPELLDADKFEELQERFDQVPEF